LRLADENAAGNVVGLLAGALPLGRIPTAALWGMLADRIGNPRATLLSMLGLCAGNLAFGLCTSSFYAAVACRAVLLGALNGLPTLLGPLCMDVGGVDHQADVLGPGLTA
jgi:MFS family permease